MQSTRETETEIKVTSQKADETLNAGMLELSKSEYDRALNLFTNASIYYRDLELPQGVSICMSWSALCSYLLQRVRYEEILNLLLEAKFLAKKTDFRDAMATNTFVNAIILYYENNFTEAEALFLEVKNSTKNRFLIEKTEILLNKLIQHKTNSIEQLERKLEKDTSNSAFLSLLKLGRLVSAETNIDTLIETIAKETAKALVADRCTVFMLDKSTNELWSKVATGMGSKEIRFPADKGLAGHVAMTGNTINIRDAYQDERFNKDIDNKTGYVTKTILCMPMRNIKHEIVGVFQVLNKVEGEFTSEDEELLIALGSSAGIALENSRLFEHQQKMLEEQKLLFNSFIDTLATSIDARDKITSGHSSRVTLYSQLICDRLGMNEKEKELIKHAATLHDIGKIGIKDSVLQKEGKLTSDEYAHIQQHAFITHEILSKIYSTDKYAQVADIAASHHEKFDGTGYYLKHAGKEIPLGGRILAVADVFDAITSKRHYRNKMPIENAIKILKEGVGKHFDPDIVDIFLDISCDKMIDVFLSEFHCSLDDEHRRILEKYSMAQLYEIITREDGEITLEEATFADTFKEYYDDKLESDEVEDSERIEEKAKFEEAVRTDEAENGDKTDVEPEK